ncbi:GH14491 [Drosophila grimshawi]|uniref:GH14491 n=1 Tax=Drosophila grimshawi TaxID=7222 RepID=B4J011_DROGR|nr:GH14491 [Drosophila grimshawi]
MPNGVSLPNHPNFINQLAAAITTATVAQTTAATPNKTTTTASGKMKPHSAQGSAPMDLENENEIDDSDVIGPVKAGDKLPPGTALTLPDAAQQLYLNGLMHTPPGYLYFPSAQNAAAAAAAVVAATPSGSTTASGNASNSNAQMLMDPSAMMAAAMQQMQHNYAAAGYVAAATAAGMPTDAAGTGLDGTLAADGSTAGLKEVIKTKNCILFPPNPNAPPPTIRERPPGCRTVFVGGLPENITEEVIREIFESCGEITTLRMSKKNFCHIRYRHEAAIDRAIYLSGYRLRISSLNEPPNFGRLHVDYAQARDDQYDYECKQRQLQREQRHRERMSLDRMRSQSPPPIPHYTDHEATAVAEHLRNNETFVKAIQTITTWLERGDCTKRNANVFYSMIQSTHAHVRRLHTDKQQLEEDLRKARECYRKQMGTMSTQFTQIEKVFNAASHKKVWDHFTKAQRKNIDQWKKLATELRTVQIDDDEMEISDDERDYDKRPKRTRYDSDGLKDENDSLRCQLEAMRNEMSVERSDCQQREKQIKVLQETIRNMQTQLLQTKLREQKDSKTIEQLERNLKEAGVKQLLLKTKIKETADKLKDRETYVSNSSNADFSSGDSCSRNAEDVRSAGKKEFPSVALDLEIIDIDKVDDDVRIIEHQSGVVEIHEIEDDEKLEPTTEPHKAIDDEAKQLPISENSPKSDVVEPVVESVPTQKSNMMSLAMVEAKIIALTSAFLVLHPHGVDIASIASYLRGMLLKSLQLRSNDELANVLTKYTNLFKSEQSKWSFCGFTDEPLDANANRALTATRTI